MAGNLGKKPPKKSKPKPVKVSVPYAPTPKGKAAEKKANAEKKSVRVRVPYAPTPKGKRAEEAASPKSRGPYAGSSPGLTPSPATKKRKRRANRRMREVAADDYRSKAISRIMAKNVEIDVDTGQPKTTTRKIPLLKTSPRKLKTELKDLHRSLKVAKLAGAEPGEIKSARIAGQTRIARHNFKLNKKGEVRFREVTVPKIKTSSQQIRKELKQVNRRTKLIKQGKRKHDIILPGATEHTTWLTDAVGAATPVMGNLLKAGKIAVMGPTGALAEEFFRKNAPKAISAATKYAERSNRTQQAGFGPGAPMPEWLDEGRTKLMRGVRTGVLSGFEMLTRPGLAVEQELARSLGGKGDSPLLKFIGEQVLTKKARKEFREAPSGLDAILHGHKTKKLVTGGKLGEEIFGLKQLGLPIDLVTDPLMYFTFAGAPAKFAERSAALTERLARQAPEAIKDVRFATLSAQAAKSGDYEFLHHYLTKVAQDNGVSLARLGHKSGEKAAIKRVQQTIKERGRELSEMITKGTAEAPRTKLSSKALRAATEEAARFGLRRQVRPGVQVEFRPLLLKKVGGVSVYLPERAANLRFVPRAALVSDIMGKSRSNELIREMRSREVTEGVNRELAAEHTRLLDEVRVAQRSPDQRILADAERALRTFEDKAREIKTELTEQARAASLGRQSPREITQRINSRRFAHEMWRFPRSLGTGVQITTQRAFRTAMKPILKDKVARGRVGLHLMFDADTQMRGLLEEAVPLSAKEQKVLGAVREVNEEMAAFGIDLGTIENVRENYFFRDWQRGGDVLGPLDSGDFSSKLKPTGGKRGSRSAPQMHRHMAEAMAMADPTRIASMIMKVGPKGISRDTARKVAERGYQYSLTRFAAEDMAQYLQRGGILREESMTPIQKAAYKEANRWESAGESIPPLFQDLEATDGVLKLSDRGIEYHGLKEHPFDGLSGRESLRVALSSARESEAKLEDAVRLADNGSRAADHYAAALAQRREEIQALQDQLFTYGSGGGILRPSKTPVVRFPSKKPEPPGKELRAEIEGLKQHREVVEKELSDLQGSIKAAPDMKAKKAIAESFSARAADIESIDNELDTLQRQLQELEGPAPSEEAANYTIRDQRPPEVVDAAQAPPASVAGLANDAELGDFVPNATEDYIGTLRDFRRDHPDEFPIIDPMLSNYHRTRSEGLQTVFQLRWKGIDAAVGRDIAEAQRNRYVLADGREGFVTDLKLDYGPLDNPHDKPIAYVLRNNSERIEPQDIEFPEPTLIPNKNHDIWYDPETGHEYKAARMFDDAVGDAIERSVGKGRLWPTHVIDNVNAEFLRMGEGGVQDLYDSGIEAGWRKLRSLQRYGVTTLFPAFAVRNMISDALLSTATDPGVWFHPIANTKMAAIIALKGGKVKIGPAEFGVGYVRIPGWGKVKSEDMLASMETLGLHTGQHISEFAQLAEKGDIRTIEKWFQRKVWKRPAQIAAGGFGLGPSRVVGRFAREANTRLQDIPRMVTFAQAMRATKGDFAESMWRTIKTHFDYGDLTAAERRTARNLFLFYTWYRKNIPFQFMNLITRPGFFSAVTHTYIDTAQGEAPWNFNWSKVNPILPNMEGQLPHGGLVPDYMFTSLSALATNWNGHALAVGFGAPWADINLVTNMLTRPNEGLRSAAGLLAPELTGLFEFALKKNLLTGRELGGKESSGYASIFNFMTEKFGFALPEGEDGSPVLPWQANLMLNQIPVLNRGSNYFRGGPSSAEDQGRMNKLMGGGLGSFFTGLNAYVSPKEGSRLHYAYINRVIGRAQQRRAFSEEPNVSAKELAQFDKETYEWAKQLGIPRKYLEVVPSIGKAYITQEEREGFRLSGSSPLTGGSGGLSGLLGRSGGGLGGLDLDRGAESYNSEGEEALEKYQKPGKFQEDFQMKGLLGQGLMGEEELPALMTGVGSASAKQLMAAEWRLHANKRARENKLAAPTVKEPGVKKAKPKAQNDLWQRMLHEGNPEPHTAPLAKPKKPKKKGTKVPKIDGITHPGEAQEFAQWLAFYTGFDPQAVGAWVQSEGGAFAAGGEAGKNNWLGVGYPGQPTEFGRSKYFAGNAKQAAKATADWIAGKIGGDMNYAAAQGIKEMIPKASGGNAEDFLRALEESGWGTDVSAVAQNLGMIKARGTTWAKPAKKLKGSWAGTQNILLNAAKGFEVSSTKRTPEQNAAVGGAEDSDHLTTNKTTFATDLPTTDGVPVAQKVAKRLQLDQDWEPGNYNWYTSQKYPGYRFQLLWAVQGHFDHVHVGAEWVGDNLPPGTYLGGAYSSGTAGGFGLSGTAGGFTSGKTEANYNIGRSAKTEQSVTQMRQRLVNAGKLGGATGGASLGTGPFLTTTETFNLGGSQNPITIVAKLRAELEKSGKL